VATVSVLVHFLPNTLCNTDCLEVVLEQAGLGGSISSLEAWPGLDGGEAVIRLTDLDSANKCVRHFHGCRWDCTGKGSAVTAELAQAAGMCGSSADEASTCDSDVGRESNIHSDNDSHEPTADKSDGGFKKPSPLASPALSASTVAPSSPCVSTFSSPSSPWITPLSRLGQDRKISWADLMSDDEFDDDEEKTTEDAESGSGGVNTSDDGF
jgi:hypothetical protein